MWQELLPLVTSGTAVALPPDFMPNCPELLASWTAERNRSIREQHCCIQDLTLQSGYRTICNNSTTVYCVVFISSYLSLKIGKSHFFHTSFLFLFFYGCIIKTMPYALLLTHFTEIKTPTWNYQLQNNRTTGKHFISHMRSLQVKILMLASRHGWLSLG